jgi:hypothetical protein
MTRATLFLKQLEYEDSYRWATKAEKLAHIVSVEAEEEVAVFIADVLLKGEVYEESIEVRNKIMSKYKTYQDDATFIDHTAVCFARIGKF